MSVQLPNGKNFFATSTGAPLVGGKVYAFVPNSSTPKDTYTTAAGGTPNAHPVVLDARGEAAIYWSGSYDVTLKDSAGSTIWGPERLEDAGGNALTDLASTSDAAKGDALIGVKRTESGGIATTQHAINQLRPWFVSADSGALLNGVADDTAFLQHAANVAKLFVVHAGGIATLSDTITLSDDATVVIEAGARVNQTVVGKAAFRATGKGRVTIINNGIIHGPGGWSAAWTGNGGHDERGVEFITCVNSGVVGHGVIRNFGHAQVSIQGCTNIKVRGRLEGTHTHGTPLTATVSNFQMGVYVTDDTTYGLSSNIDIDCDISGSAQGIVREHRYVGTGDIGPLKIRGHIHDIPAQHGLYIQDGNLDVDITVKDITLSAVKVQSPDVNIAVSNVKANVVGDTIGSHVFEVATLQSSGSLNNLDLSCQVTGVSGALLSTLGPMNRMKARLIGSDVVLGFQAQGDEQHDIEVDITATDIAESGVAIYATNSDFKIKATLRDPGTAAAGTHSGILVDSATATVDLYDPDVTDSASPLNQIYGLFNKTAGSVVRVHGSAKFTGATDTAVRATGIITEWPTEVTLSGTNGDWTTPANVSSSQPMVLKATSTSAATVVLWEMGLADESAYHIQVLLTGKLSTSAERKIVTMTGAFYRDAGGAATITGSVDEDVAVASGGFGGAYALTVSGNSVVVNVNSGGAATYSWTARITVTKVV